MSQSAAEKELEYFRNTLKSFDDYARYHASSTFLASLPFKQLTSLHAPHLQLSANHARRMGFLTLPKDQRAMLVKLGYRDKLDAVDEGIRRNGEFLDEIYKSGAEPFMDDLQHEGYVITDVQDVQGKPEREACYDPCIAALEKHYEHIPPAERRKVKVLIPGAGLGRLALEVAGKATNLLRSVRIPDVLPVDILPPDADFSFVAGDWCEVYGGQSESGAWPPGEQIASDQQGQWGAVVTCFFIDTARNIINYLRIIKGLLKDDGVWVNVGPLLWHFENIVDKERGEGSIELSLDEVKQLARDMGFELSNETMSKTTYTGDPDGMLKSEYTVIPAFART
ncbi:hypothetical protein QFC22_005001 [Naganishia vaughanmartiniae]|uniref:Uncharacterized protein n=1 Tax=Naganishia vaughanmartiniae TaxID=1424756 RepID=A0ACC2WXK1_9TREE|nr:hypothetical protein QFC22_005001 [Naganishia vaughanmartiniae]